LDDQEWEYSISIKEFSQLKLGNHILTVRAIDQSGNVDASPIIFQWKIIKKVLPLLITKIQIANEKMPTTNILNCSILTMKRLICLIIQFKKNLAMK